MMTYLHISLCVCQYQSLTLDTWCWEFWGVFIYKSY